MEITLTDILMVILMIVSVVITYFVVPLMKAKCGSETQSYILSIVMTAVEAAEQIYRESGMGKIKKAYVSEYLKEKGFKLDEKDLDNMIESCVLELNRETL